MRTVLFIFLTFVSAAFALPLDLGSPFTENMVLQRDSKVPVWGWGKPASEVCVTVAGKEAAATVGEDGSWKLELDALPVGGPYKFQATSGDETITYTNVLVGDVWICSGQSNMEFGYQGMIGKEKILAGIKGRPIRCMNIQKDISFTPQARCHGKWSTKPVPSAVALSFSYYLQKDLDVPIGIILTCWGSSSIEGWMPKDMTQELPHFERLMQEFEKNDAEKVRQLLKMRDQGKTWPRKDNVFLRTRPNILYNAMMYPVIPYAARGIVWYQGEANAKSVEDMQQYAESLQQWCKKMRSLWGRDDLHLLVVMLPKIGRVYNDKGITDPTAHSWAWMRESQMKILELPHTSIANTIDLGDVKKVHPKDKAPVGQRLALLARRDVYGQKLLAQGPQMKSVKIEGGNVTITYDNAEGLTTTDGKAVRGFWVAGKSRQWKAVEGRIEGQTVVLECGDMPHEVVRYAFCAVPDVNLINAAKLPALPFRTDTDKP